MNKTHRTPDTHLLVISYHEVRAGDIILAASGPSCYLGQAYNFTNLALTPVPEADLFLYHGEPDNGSILVVERRP